MDLDAYFRRIDYSDATDANLDTLAALTLAHARAIPFENLDPLLGRPVRLEIADLERKLVTGGRGGYCFEHNTLFAHALEALGFSVTGLTGRVVMNMPPDTILPRTHMLLLVEVAGDPVIADVGFGGLAPTGPLRLETDVAQQTPHESYRLMRHDRDYRLEALVDAVWTPLYEFDLQVQRPSDYVMMNHFTATFPDSIFLNSLVAARATDGGRLAFRNNVMSVHRTGAASERRTLATATEIRDALTGPFGIALPDDPRLEAVFERFTAEPCDGR